MVKGKKMSSTEEEFMALENLVVEGQCSECINECVNFLLRN
jgi:hypothetical protein